MSSLCYSNFIRSKTETFDLDFTLSRKKFKSN